MYCKLSSKYLAIEDIVEGSKLKSFSRAKSFLEAKDPFNLSILLSSKEKVRKVAFNRIKKVTEA